MVKKNNRELIKEKKESDRARALKENLKKRKRNN